MDDRRILDALLRKDLAAFTHKTFQIVSPGATFLQNWHIQAIAHHLRQAYDRKITRLIITMPPRNLKSISASVAFVAWALGQNPNLKYICASYSNELSAKHARDTRAVMSSADYKRLFPRSRLNPKKSAELEFETLVGGGRYSTSLGGTLTGRGGNFLIVDDPMKPQDAQSDVQRKAVKEWYDQTLYTRLDDKQADVIIVIMQRLHEDDLVGHLLEKDPSWVHLDLPAIAIEDQEIPIGANEIHHRKAGDVLHAEREPLAVLERTKVMIGSLTFSAQYQQRPVPLEGNLIKRAWFQTYGDLPERKTGVRVVQSWDTATSTSEQNDYSVCTTWLVSKRDYYLIDVLRIRLEFPALRKRIIAHAQKHRANAVLIEDAGPGKPMLQDLRTNPVPGMPLPIGIKPEGDKVVRMEAQSTQIEVGQVHLPADASWLDEFIRELLAFPKSRHDHQVDSVSQFLKWISRRPRTGTLAGPTVVTLDGVFGSTFGSGY
ncbi:MAG: phage terminase large subunit [Alphaproteobacteria bacterium]